MCKSQDKISAKERSMKNEDYKKLCDTTFNSLFHKAQLSNERMFLTSLFPFYTHANHTVLSYIPDYEFDEVLDLISSFNLPEKDMGIDAKTQSRVRLLVYCHVIEVDFVYMIISNLIRSIDGRGYSMTLQRKTKKGLMQALENPSPKIELLSKEASGLGISLKDIFDPYFDGALRNAFGHSQYYLHDEGGLEMTTYHSPSSKKFMKSGKPMYTAEEITNFYEYSRIFIRSFIECYDGYLKPYADGHPHDTYFRPIVYNETAGWYFHNPKPGKK